MFGLLVFDARKIHFDTQTAILWLQASRYGQTALASGNLDDCIQIDIDRKALYIITEAFFSCRKTSQKHLSRCSSPKFQEARKGCREESNVQQSPQVSDRHQIQKGEERRKSGVVQLPHSWQMRLNSDLVNRMRLGQIYEGYSSILGNFLSHQTLGTLAIKLQKPDRLIAMF